MLLSLPRSRLAMASAAVPMELGVRAFGTSWGEMERGGRDTRLRDGNGRVVDERARNTSRVGEAGGWVLQKPDPHRSSTSLHAAPLNPDPQPYIHPSSMQPP